MQYVNEEVSSRDLYYLVQLPSRDIIEFSAMWAFGNYYRTQDVFVGNPYISYDSSEACVAKVSCHSSTRDRRPLDSRLKYVGVLRNILRVDYAVLKINIMECSWIKPNLAGNRTIFQDAHGFWLVKKDAFQSSMEEPYILPVHASQVGLCFLK
jgi:hypothetical protein